MAVRPAAQAASVVLAATRPMPTKSIAESVLPGLKPYQPNHSSRPPEAAMVRSCGSIGPPPSRLNLRPRRGPRTMAPARAMKPPMVWTTVEPAKSWKLVPSARQEVAGAAHGGQEAVRTPGPVADDRIDEARDGDAVEQIADEAGAADHGAGGDGGAGVGEGELEDPDGQEGDAGGLIGRRRALQEEPVVADEAVAVAEHEGEAEGVEENAAEAGVDDALHQHVDGLARAAEAGFEHGEADLHAEDQEGRDQRPRRC